ncbi:MAG TPA: hypothetical protein VFE79_26215 [Paraburkholderia sp.]|jgi:hypothetical protein|nr:hypothetical protein [Paraburkholderia sp.]
MKTISTLAAMRLNQSFTTQGEALPWRRRVAQSRALFAAPPADLLTLVIADAIKRKAQAEIQRDALRDAMYEMPVSSERQRERGADMPPPDPDDYT